MVYPQIETGGDPGAVRAIGDAAVDLGFDYLLAYDHVVGAEHADREPKLVGPYPNEPPFFWPSKSPIWICSAANACGWVSASGGTTSSTRHSARTSRLAVAGLMNRSSTCDGSGRSH